MDNYLAETLLELGEWEEAGSAAAEALAISERGVTNGAWLRCLLTTVRGREGRLEEAQRLLIEARRQAGQHPNVFEEESISLAEARLATIEGRWPEALTAFEATARLQAKIEKRWYHAQTLREWAEAHLARNEPGDRERATELLRESLSLFEAMNVPKYAGMVRERLQQLESL